MFPPEQSSKADSALAFAAPDFPDGSAKVLLQRKWGSFHDFIRAICGLQ